MLKEVKMKVKRWGRRQKLKHEKGEENPFTLHHDCVQVNFIHYQQNFNVQSTMLGPSGEIEKGQTLTEL